MPHPQLWLFDDIPQPAHKSTREETFADYGAFVEKFKAKRTTDDCYTPAPVMEAVERYVRTHYDVDGRPFVRPFYPGGDFQNFDYPEDCVVVDNPPSVYTP